ncbi:hypothetical protein [Streptomyces fulvoviolaceus]|uniref:hypothetical protein n=1 Tax=Streptomyces fulvoviolaceus TaxID=285535 RepID=UPI000AB0F13C|nr:hypothetical protein [Streptomyces fulvoviolaceus]MCT9078575.1 hypothetical protein [Streptomyces fulvoviolaceus]
MSAPTTRIPPLSAECTLAQRLDFKGLHRECTQTEDVPLPHSYGILLVQRHGAKG